MPRETFTIELDREEALMLTFLSYSSGSHLSRVQRAVDRVAAALHQGDPTLQQDRLDLWKRYEKPLFDLSAGPHVPADEL